MRALVIGAAAAVLAAAGLIDIRNATRRADDAAVAAARANLDAIPLTLGDWAGEKQEYDAKQQDRSGAFAAASRVYRNAKTHDAVAVLVLAGPATEVGAHDPNRCYVGSGYRPVGSSQRKELADATPTGPCTYWAARFDTDTFPAVSLQVNWAWTLDGLWVASDDARYEFGRQPVLYKLYVSRRLNALAAAPQTADPSEAFLKDFFPAVRDVLKAK